MGTPGLTEKQDGTGCEHKMDKRDRTLVYSAYSVNKVCVKKLFKSQLQKITLQVLRQMQYLLKDVSFSCGQQGLFPDNEVKDFVVRQDTFQKQKKHCMSLSVPSWFNPTAADSD